ncbi:hypothetical protein [Bombella apis]|uniref:hypothetical protein n=1 Tax=Bombella apis TaxID=1785988 RepID=UPI0012B8ABEE|nr:hypothetical protein [Bombella apis]MPV99790.1 hypothetical protein [Bombella apis]MPV99792.1 hypothetical protein [Bombella apis]
MKKSGTTGVTIKQPEYTPHHDQYSIPPDRAEQLSVLLSRIFGDKRGSVKEAAQVIDMNYSNLLKMLKSKRPIPQWIFDRLTSIEASREIPFPDENSENPEQDGIAAVSPSLSELLMRANRAGWSNGQIFFSILNWCMKKIAETVGHEAAEKIFEDALENYKKNSGVGKKPLA